MPLFSFTVPIKEKTKKTTSTNTSKYEILKSGVEGVVFINIDASYVVAVEEANYKITPENYSCAGIPEIYCQLLKINEVGHMNRLRIVRPEGERHECNPNNFLPFVAGCVVKGNIVRHRIAKNVYFKIKKVSFNSENVMARIAIKFFRLNYKEIMSAKINSLDAEQLEILSAVFEEYNINVNDYKIVE